MKRILLFTTALFVSSFNLLTAQGFTEDFESGVIPEDFVLINGDGLIPALEDDVSWADTAWIASGSSTFEGSAALSISWYWDENENDVGPCDDWMILPKMVISENAAMTFDAKSATSTGDFPDDYWVLVNTGDPTIESFENDGEILLQIDDEESLNFSTRTIDLSNYAGQEVHIAFRNVTNTDGYGLWIDNISVGGSVATETVASDYFAFEITPNPTSETANITYNLPISTEVTITVNDLLGRTIGVWTQGKQPTGNNSFSLPVTAWTAGTYLVSVRTEDKVATQKLIVR